MLEESNCHRVQELVPIRYGRMLRSPFTFLRGSAGLMTYDLSTTPGTGLRVQACGDCHLLNFGAFATPERNLIFDINDFDETLPAPWEWDLKRLCTSFAVAVRDNNLSDEEARDAAVACAGAYREDAVERARRRIGEYLVPKLTTEVDGRHRLVDQPPVLFHVAEKGAGKLFREALEGYRASLPDDRRALFDRYRLEDSALKVVGIGSVGTRCFVGLFMSPEGHPLLLQFKEACPSMLAALCGQECLREPGVTGRRRAAPDAVLQRHIPGLDARCPRSRFLRAPVARHEVFGRDSRRVGGAVEGLCAIVRDGTRPGPRALRRCGNDQRLSRQIGCIRPGNGRVRAGMRRPDDS